MMNRLLALLLLSAGFFVAPFCGAATKAKVKAGVQHFDDHTSSDGTFVRTGAGTQAKFDDTENHIQLSKGILLASSKPGGAVVRSGVTLDAGTLTNKAHGTMLVAYMPGKFLKITCLEGSVFVRLRALFAEHLTIRSGQMLIMNPTDKRLPDVVDINLHLLSDTSAMMSDLPDFVQRNIAQAITDQNVLIQKGREVLSPVVMPGAGLQLVVANEGGVTRQNPPTTTTTNTGSTTTRTGGGDGGGGSTTTQTTTTTTNTSNDPFVINNSSTYASDNVTTPGRGSIPASPDGFGGWKAVAPQSLLFQESPVVPLVPGITGAYEFLATNNLTVQGALQGNGNHLILDAGAGGTQQTVLVTGAGAGVSNNGPLALAPSSTTDVTISNGAQVTAGGSGSIFIGGATATISGNAQVTAPGGPISICPSKAMVITNSSVSSGSDIGMITSPVAGVNQSMTISGSVIKNTGAGPNGAISVGNSSPTQHVDITIQNSSQLLAIATVSIQNGGGNLQVSNSTISCSGPTSNILIDIADNVSLTNANMSAGIIKARSRNGPELFVQGGTFNATGLVRLYAEGAGNLHFAGNVNLNAPVADLAGNAVTVDTGGAVHVTGTANVYATQHNYNTGSFGTINATTVNQNTFANRPNF